MAVPGKGRVVASVLVIIFIIVGFFFFDPLGSKYPEGVDTDAIELRSVTLSGDNYEVVTYDDELYELPSTVRPPTSLPTAVATSCRATATSCGSRPIPSTVWASRASM